MTETGTPQASSPAPSTSTQSTKSLLIRPWPKVVFFYPTFIVATVFWLISMFSEGGSETASQLQAVERALGTEAEAVALAAGVKDACAPTVGVQSKCGRPTRRRCHLLDATCHIVGECIAARAR